MTDRNTPRPRPGGLSWPVGSVHTQRPDGTWGPAAPLGWQEEHSRPQQVLLWILGRGHCGKAGRRG